MERLTIRNSDGTYSQPTDTTFYALFTKVSQFEDIIEKHEVIDFNDLDRMLADYNKIKDMYFCKEFVDLYEENVAFKNALNSIETENKELRKQLSLYKSGEQL